MVSFNALISSFLAPGQTSLIIDPHFFSTFPKANHIVWLNDFFSRNFKNTVLLSKSIAKFVNLCLQNEIRYRTGVFVSLRFWD